MNAFPRAQRIVAGAITSRVAPCVVVEVGSRSAVLWREAAGRLTYADEAAAASDLTVFDLASLTKVLATTLIAMRLVDDGRVDLGARVADLLPSWRAKDRSGVRVSDLLTHSSGLPAHRPLHEYCSGRTDFEKALSNEPLEYRPGTRSVYSDLGFILLGFVLEDAGAEPLDRQFEQLLRTVLGDTPAGKRVTDRTPTEIRFRPPAGWRERIAPTRADLACRGIVHDANAAALGGVAGHAGLFGTAPAVGTIARAILRTTSSDIDRSAVPERDTATRFVSKAGIPGSSRAFGWDTMLPTSSCGARISPEAFGHTGFTGTSLWIDPTAGLYVVLLTNRVYPAPGSADDITTLRRAVHDAVMTDYSNREG
jgi:serine-type D-Ala-D-Ala carboxypeptidase